MMQITVTALVLIGCSNQIHFLLKRLGIRSIKRQTMITEQPIYYVDILPSELDRFQGIIRKKNAVRNHTQSMCSTFNTVPYEYVKDLQCQLKTSIQMDEHGSMTYDSYKLLCDHHGLENRFEHQCLIKIECIKKMENSDQIKLCDMTVLKNHNFLMSGILIHNSEGLDIPDLNTEILSTPSTDVEQAVGRILRKVHATLRPMVIDLIDDCGNFRKQSAIRTKLYRQEDYDLHDISIDLDQPLNKQQLNDYLSDMTSTEAPEGVDDTRRRRRRRRRR